MSLAIARRRPACCATDRTNTRDTFVIIPTSIALADCLPAKLKKHLAKAEYFVNLIARGLLRGDADERGFVPLKHLYLRNVMGQAHMRPIVQALIRAEIVITDRRWVVGEKSIGYGFPPRVAESPFSRRRVTDSKLANKLQTQYGLHEAGDLLPVHLHLAKWLEATTIDTAQARVVICETPDLAKNAGLHESVLEEFWLNSFGPDFAVDPYGRFHSVVTRVAKQLRPHIAIDGKTRLAAIDVRNCQPLLVALALRIAERNPQLYNPRRFGSRFRQSTYLSAAQGQKQEEAGTRGGKTRPNPKPNTMIDFTQVLKVQPVEIDASPPIDHADDVSRYIQLCEAGQFYESFVGLDAVMGMGRDDIKARLLKTIFDDPSELHHRPQEWQVLDSALRTLYPTIHAFVRKLKRQQYEHAARLCQSIESSIVIGGIANRLRLEHPQMPLVTIHDAVIVPCEAVDSVQEIMAQEFRRWQVNPSFKVELLARERREAVA